MCKTIAVKLGHHPDERQEKTDEVALNVLKKPFPASFHFKCRKSSVKKLSHSI
tara:strand:+ start:3525 stop:3683 length:159 start_codon:yes stop_codon:yes gene_type:complete